MKPIVQIRAEFEAWAKSHGVDPRRIAPWLAWKEQERRHEGRIVEKCKQQEPKP